MIIKSIQFKVVSIIIIVLLFAISSTVILTISDHKKDLIQSTEQTLSINTGILNSAIRNIMLTGEAPIAKVTMDELKSLPFLNEVDLYRVDGSRAFNDYLTIEMVNEYQNSMTFQKTERVENKTLDSSYFNSVLETKTPRVWEDRENKTLEYLFPILNYSECRDCHGNSGFVRGVAHFTVSLDGIYKRIRSSAIRSIITLMISGFIIATLLIYLIKRTVLSPIGSIGEVVKDVGRGNLERKIELETSDELSSLGETINTMIYDLKDRNRLLVRNKVIETRNKESKKYLDNIQEGLVLLNKKYEITYTYSNYFVELFQIENPEGESIFDIIYPEKSSEKVDNLKDFLDMIFNNPLAEMDMIMEINPLKNTSVTLANNKKIIIDAYFARIYNEFDDIENIMVIFKDRTKIFKAQEELRLEKERSESEIEILSTILKNGRYSIEEYYRDLANLIDSLESGKINKNQLREIHTLKGTSKYYELNSLAMELHKLEDDINSKIAVDSTITKVKSYLKNLQTIIIRFDEFINSPEKASINTFMTSLEGMVKSLSFELDKPVVISYKNSLKTELDIYPIHGILIHLIRNSIDHGIEERFTRATEGKREVGTIFLNFLEDETNYRIQIGDDGRGIDFVAIRDIAIEKGLIDLNETKSEKELVNLLFSHGFSSITSATELSGRGIGLDAVKDKINKLNGSISLKTEKGIGTMFSLTIPKESL